MDVKDVKGLEEKMMEFIELSYEEKKQMGELSLIHIYLRIHNIFEDYKPDIVFHAAAHKHVPLMEDSPHDAIKNNVFGTFNIAKEAGMSGVKSCLLYTSSTLCLRQNTMNSQEIIIHCGIYSQNSF